MSDSKATIQGITGYMWGISVYESPNAPQASANSVKLGSAMLEVTNDDVQVFISSQNKFQDPDFALTFFDKNKESLSDIMDELIAARYTGSDLLALKIIIQTEESDKALLEAYNSMRWVNVSGTSKASELQKTLALWIVDNAVYEVISQYRAMKDLESHFEY